MSPSDDMSTQQWHNLAVHTIRLAIDICGPADTKEPAEFAEYEILEPPALPEGKAEGESTDD